MPSRQGVFHRYDPLVLDLSRDGSLQDSHAAGVYGDSAGNCALDYEDAGHLNGTGKRTLDGECGVRFDPCALYGPLNYLTLTGSDHHVLELSLFRHSRIMADLPVESSTLGKIVIQEGTQLSELCYKLPGNQHNRDPVPDRVCGDHWAIRGAGELKGRGSRLGRMSAMSPSAGFSPESPGLSGLCFARAMA